MILNTTGCDRFSKDKKKTSLNMFRNADRPQSRGVDIALRGRRCKVVGFSGRSVPLEVATVWTDARPTAEPGEPVFVLINSPIGTYRAPRVGGDCETLGFDCTLYDVCCYDCISGCFVVTIQVAG